MKAISSMATRQVLADLTDAAAAAGLPLVRVESVGGVDAARRVAAGEEFDLVFLADDALHALAAGAHVDAATITPLVLSRVAVAVPDSGSPAAEASQAVAFADDDALRAALGAARSVGYSTGPSGTALRALIDDLGLTSALQDRLVQARPGVPVASLLADGDVDLGFQQLSELVGQPGVRILGLLPAHRAITTLFSGAVATASADPDGAARVLGVLASAEFTPIVSGHHFERA